MTDTERAWMDYFVAYEDYAKNKESAYCLYLAYKHYGNGTFKELRKSYNDIAIQARIAWELRLEARKKGIIVGKYEQVLRKYALLNLYYKESREDWLFLAKTLYKPYKEFRCKDVIKKIWKLRKKVIKLRNKFNACNV